MRHRVCGRPVKKTPVIRPHSNAQAKAKCIKIKILGAS
ncbi:hypothetical protein UUU_02740 [Klebsiella pneumoniae subsp. pneumoniae DSM 30104 = JCM 1662 = NBRC 14940]|nr:hypothetical protein UUU_02740 [Klebsiella pneumoniae subsp. pneumoniae DSM 30104 = JCM 1662 = NBRC 14940]